MNTGERRNTMPAFTVTLVSDKVTPGTVRFMEPDVTEGDRPLSIYPPKERVESLGLEADEGTTLKLTVERA